MFKNQFTEHLHALFKANNSFLRFTCLGHVDVLGSSVPVASEEQLNEQIEYSLGNVAIWESIEVQNQQGDVVFSMKSADPVMDMKNTDSSPKFPHSLNDEGFNFDQLVTSSMSDNRSMIKSGMYKHLFDNECGTSEASFDDLLVTVTDENKHLVIPMLLAMATQEVQKQKVQELAERLKFDIECVEHGVKPDAQGQA